MSVEDTSAKGQYDLIFEGRLVPGRVASEVESVFAKKFIYGKAKSDDAAITHGIFNFFQNFTGQANPVSIDPPYSSLR